MAERAFNLLTSTIGECMRICEQRKMNAAVLDELKLLLKTLQDTNDLLQRKIKEGSHHRNIHSSALDALRIDLESVMEDANTIKNLGLLKSYWNASETQAKLQSLRERVVISFQTKILFATLDVLEGLRCVTLEQCSEGESSGSGSKERAQSSDLYKWYEDPILLETMSDPVKASDGITYDRWTLLARSSLMLENNGPLLILVDDIDVQKRLFDEFPEQLEVYKSKRAAFKEAALQAAHTGHLGDALVMLNHVLKWAPHDASCRIERDRVQRAVLQDCCAITTGFLERLDPSPTYTAPEDMRRLGRGECCGSATTPL